MNIVVSDVTEGGIDGDELKGEEFLGEETVCLVDGGVLSERDAVVHRRLGVLLNFRLDRHRREGRGAGARANAEENEEAWMGNPLGVVIRL